MIIHLIIWLRCWRRIMSWWTSSLYTTFWLSGHLWGVLTGTFNIRSSFGLFWASVCATMSSFLLMFCFCYWNLILYSLSISSSYNLMVYSFMESSYSSSCSYCFIITDSASKFWYSWAFFSRHLAAATLFCFLLFCLSSSVSNASSWRYINELIFLGRSEVFLG